MIRKVRICCDYYEKLALRKTDATTKRGKFWSPYVLLDNLYISDKGFVGEFFSLVDHKKSWDLLDISEVCSCEES